MTSYYVFVHMCSFSDLYFPFLIFCLVSPSSPYQYKLLLKNSLWLNVYFSIPSSEHEIQFSLNDLRRSTILYSSITKAYLHHCYPMQCYWTENITIWWKFSLLSFLHQSLSATIIYLFVGNLILSPEGCFNYFSRFINVVPFFIFYFFYNRYDLLHNSHLKLEGLHELFKVAKVKQLSLTKHEVRK